MKGVSKRVLVEVEKLGRPFPMRATCSHCGAIKVVEKTLKDFKNHPLLCDECVEKLENGQTPSGEAILKLAEDGLRQVEVALSDKGNTLRPMKQDFEKIRAVAQRLIDERVFLRKAVEERMVGRKVIDTRVVASEDAHRNEEDEWFISVLSEPIQS